MSEEQQRKLNRLKFNYESSIAEFECIKPLTEVLTILGKKIGPFKENNSYKLEYFVGKILVVNGYLKKKDGLDSKFIEKLSFQESTTQDILKLNKNTFIQMHSDLELLFKLTNQGKMPVHIYKQYSSKAYDFIRVRLNKILKFASINQSQGKDKIISEEEEILFKTIADAIGTFHRFFDAGIWSEPSEK